MLLRNPIFTPHPSPHISPDTPLLRNCPAKPTRPIGAGSQAPPLLLGRIPTNHAPVQHVCPAIASANSPLQPSSRGSPGVRSRGGTGAQPQDPPSIAEASHYVPGPPAGSRPAFLGKRGWSVWGEGGEGGPLSSDSGVGHPNRRCYSLRQYLIGYCRSSSGSPDTSTLCLGSLIVLSSLPSSFFWLATFCNPPPIPPYTMTVTESPESHVDV